MEKMCHPLAVALFTHNVEPIPAFRPHVDQLLESALAQPQQTFSGKDLYPTIEEKAAVLFYSLIKNHPFQNGNKRIATTSLLVFLWINDVWLKVENKELAQWAIIVADFKESPEVSRQKLLADLQNWIQNHLEIVKK